MATTPLQSPQPGRVRAHAHPTNPPVAVPVLDHVGRTIYSPHTPVVTTVIPKGALKGIEVFSDRVQVSLHGTVVEVQVTGRVVGPTGAPGKSWRSGVVDPADLDPAIRATVAQVIVQRTKILLSALA